MAHAQIGKDNKSRRQREHQAAERRTIATDSVVLQPNTSLGPRLVRKPKTPPRAVPPPEFDSEQSALDMRLRDWRKQQAHAIGLPSFFIFSDAVLRDIVLAAPNSLADLRCIHGLDSEKLERFGPAVLELCRSTI